MSSRIHFEDEADAEYRQAGRWYESRRAGLGIDDVHPLRQDPVEMIEIAFERRVTRLVPVNVKPDAQRS